MKSVKNIINGHLFFGMVRQEGELSSSENRLGVPLGLNYGFITYYLCDLGELPNFISKIWVITEHPSLVCYED